MILPRLWISLPCLSTSMISLSRPSFCVLRTFLRLFNAMLLSRMISWLYFLMSSLAFFFMVLHITLFGVYRRCFPPFLVVSSSELVTISLMCVACWFPQPLLARFVGSYVWWFHSWCRCRLVPVVSQIRFSIRVGIRSSLILFVRHLLLVASLSSIVSFRPIRPV